ncbi:MAG: hypothetical protein EOP46_11670 [Sphingobacteriaceae bacterium]|nr:MAG: hypothetical protein EOP46_11670 [Sphingobacteriaceae bacterium]
MGGCDKFRCDWNANYTATTQADAGNITGKYTLSSFSKKVMEYDGKYKKISTSYLELSRNGTYKIINAPDWLIDESGNSSQKYFTKNGKWQITCDGKRCLLQLKGIAEGNIFFKSNNKYLILLVVGDTDNCRSMVYVK